MIKQTTLRLLGAMLICYALVVGTDAQAAGEIGSFPSWPVDTIEACTAITQCGGSTTVSCSGQHSCDMFNNHVECDQVKTYCPRLSVQLYCSTEPFGSGSALHECDAIPYGGTAGGYTYSWTYQGSGDISKHDNNIIIIDRNCSPSSFPRTIRVTVTDSSGATATASDSLSCPGGSGGPL